MSCEYMVIMHRFSTYLGVLSKSVHVRLWELGEYQSPRSGVVDIINPVWIKGQLALSTVSIGCNKAKVWATVDLAKVRCMDVIHDVHVY